MAIDPHDFDDLLKKVDQLTPEERDELIERLEQRRATTPNGGPSSRSVLDGSKTRGLIGSIEDAPPDWSTNPEHMEGIGGGDGQ